MKQKEDTSTFWISSLRTGSRCSSGVYMKIMMCLRFVQVNGAKIIFLIIKQFSKYIQNRKRTKERQTLVLSRITNNSVVFLGLNRRIMTYIPSCPKVTSKSGHISQLLLRAYLKEQRLHLGTWNTVFRRGLLAACSRPISWHHLEEYKQLK